MEASEFYVAFVTAPDLETARRLAALVLEVRAAACANLIPGIESHYWWDGKVQCGAEVLLLLKTTAAQIDWLREVILKHHPYTTPEFVAMPITDGSPAYLAWIKENVGTLTPPRP